MGWLVLQPGQPAICLPTEYDSITFCIRKEGGLGTAENMANIETAVIEVGFDCSSSSLHRHTSLHTASFVSRMSEQPRFGVFALIHKLVEDREQGLACPYLCKERQRGVVG